MRRIPLVAAAVLVVAAFEVSLEWPRAVHHQAAWSTPVDLWGTVEATAQLAHGHLGAVYLPAFGVVPLPGILLLLLPAVAVCQAAHLAVGVPFSTDAFPSAWLVVGPYAMALASTALFAADAVARHRGVTAAGRRLLAAGVAVALWDVLRYGHPELALAVALVLWALDAALAGRWRRCGWLAGLAVALQPVAGLVVPLLAVAAATATTDRTGTTGPTPTAGTTGPTPTAGTTGPTSGTSPPRRPRAGAALVARATVPGLLLVLGPLVANAHRTLRAVLAQPSYPRLDHATPWLALAPRIAAGTVATGPARSIAVAAAIAVGVVAGRGAASRPGRLLWGSAAALAGFALFEPVMVAYYVFPAACLALVAIAAAAAGPAAPGDAVRPTAVAGALGRLVAGLAVAAFLAWFTLVRLDGRWAWWSAVSAALLVLLALAGRPGSLIPRRLAGPGAPPARPAPAPPAG